MRSTLNQHVFSRYIQHRLRIDQGPKERLKEWDNPRVSVLSNGRLGFYQNGEHCPKSSFKGGGQYCMCRLIYLLDV